MTSPGMDIPQTRRSESPGRACLSQHLARLVRTILPPGPRTAAQEGSRRTAASIRAVRPATSILRPDQDGRV